MSTPTLKHLRWALITLIGATGGAIIYHALVTLAIPPTFFENFNELDIATTQRPDARWRPSDTWQPLDRSYADFGASGGSNSYCGSHNEVLGGAARSPFSTVDNGSGGRALRITVRRTPDAWKAQMTEPCPWYGGILISNTNRASERFTYGYFEWRMRLPTHGKGMFPALWLFAATGQPGAKGRAEIDMFEVFGFPSGQPWGITLHKKDINGGGPQVRVASVNDNTTRWHTYGLDWQRNYLRFYKDNKQIAERTGADVEFYRDVAMSIRMNYAMDASWFPGGQRSDGSTPDELHMDVDYVARWAIKPFHNYRAR